MTKLILVRGLPGAGKTTLAKKLASETNAEMIAADDFFAITDDNYAFNFDLLKVAHEYCRGVAFYHLLRGKDVVVHNTFIETWTVGPYVEIAHKLGVQWEIVEPKTKWKSSPADCAEKNIHNVSEAAIQKMADKWVSTKDMMSFFEKQGWTN